MPFDLGGFGAILQFFAAFFGAYLLAMWISLVIWAFRDVRARSLDTFVQVLSVVLVVVFSLPGLLLYFLLRPRETLAEAYERELSEEALLQDIEEKQACPMCHQRTQPDFLLCPNCHTKLKRQCGNCHRILSLRWTVCPYCGTSVPGSTSAASAAPSGVAGSATTPTPAK